MSIFRDSRPSPAWRTLLAAAGIALLLTSAPARADSLEEADRLLRAGQHAAALQRVDRHLAAQPSEPAAAPATPAAEPSRPAPSPAAATRRDGEAIARLRGYHERPDGNTVPRYLLQMRPDQQHAIVIDTQKARLYVHRNDIANGGMPQFVADYYIAHGKLGSGKQADGMIEAWRADWESLDHERYARHYARHYARGFAAGKLDRSAWLARKRKVNAAKQWVKVATHHISMFRNPGQDEYVVVTFEQDYRSSNLSSRMLKRQYWIKEDGRWKIVREGAA